MANPPIVGGGLNTFWNNVNPSSVAFNINTGASVSQPPVNAPNPNWQLPPGAQPTPPRAQVPRSPGNLKKTLNRFPSLFNINHGN